MQGNEYQQLAWQTAKAFYKEISGGSEFHRQQLLTMLIGLCAKAGELAEEIKSRIENGDAFNYAVLEERLGNVQWYVASAAMLMNVNLEDLMGHNVAKLRERYGKNSMSSGKSANF